MATKAELEQADVIAAYYARRRRRKSLAGFVSLHRTHRLASAASITTGDIFPNRDTTFTFSVGLVFEAGTSEGLIFEFGSSTAGIAAWITNTGLGFTAGNGVAGSVDSVSGTYTIPSSGVWQTGQKIRLTFAVSPATGKIQVWMNGHEIIRARASSGTLLNGEWSDSGDGSFMDAVQGTVNLNVPAGQRIAPSNFTFTELLSVYANQLPDHFDIFSSGAGSDLIHEDFDGESIPSGWASLGGDTYANGKLVVDIAAGTEGIEFVDGSSHTELWAFFKYTVGLNVTTPGTDHARGFGFFSGSGSGTPRLYLGLLGASGVPGFRYVTFLDSGNSQGTISPAITLGQTYDIVMRWKAATAPAADDGIAQIWINKVLELNLSNLDSDTLTADNLILGNNSSAGSPTGDFLFDNIRMGITGTPPI